MNTICHLPKISLVLFLLFSGSTWAKDICCIGISPTPEGNYDTFALPRGENDCKPGKKGPGYVAGQNYCGPAAGVDLNQCASLKKADICKQCGKNWLADLGTCSEKTLEQLSEEKKAKNEKKANP